jgi:hypothetical protein
MIEFDFINPDSLVKNAEGAAPFKLMNHIFGVPMPKVGEATMLGELGFYLLVTLVVLLLCAVLMITRLIPKCKVRSSHYIVSFCGAFTFNGMIRMMSLLYLHMCVVFGKQIKNYALGDESTTESDRIVGSVMFWIMIAYPVLCFALLLKNRSKLDEDKNFKRRFENLYPGIKFKNKGISGLFYYPLFLIRRIVFVAIPTMMIAAPCYQVQLLLFLTSLYLIYFGGVRVGDRAKFREECVNEMFIMILNYHMISFTGFVQKPRA